MSKKKIGLFVVLAINSIVSGAVMGLLDLFGFIDGRHTISLTLLFAMALLIYVSLITTFLLNFAKRNRIYTFFLISSVLFGITFFLMNLNFVLSILTAAIFFTFNIYVYSASRQRSQLFITFSPHELFFPILKKSFIFFLILVAVLSYTQSQILISQNNLISPSLIRMVSRPTILMVNQQINSQLGGGTTSEIIQSLPEDQKRLIIEKALQKTVESMAQNESGTVYGFSPDEIPIHLAHISPDGHVDITPVIEAMLPNIAAKLNTYIQEYVFFAPFVVALLAFLFLQVLIIPLQLLETLITITVFKILMASKFIILKKETREVDVPIL